MFLWREQHSLRTPGFPCLLMCKASGQQLRVSVLNWVCGCWTEACFPVKYLGGVPMECCWNRAGIQKVLPGICCSFLDEHSTASQFSRSCDILLTHLGSEVTVRCVECFCWVFCSLLVLGFLCVFWGFVVGCLVLVFLLKSVGSFFSMVICKSFGSLLLIFVGSLIG